MVKRQRTIFGIVIREVRRKMAATADNAVALTALNTWLERAERIRTQQKTDKNKLYALHAPEVECISKGKARKPYEFGIKASVAITHKQGLLVGARSFTGNPYDGHILSAQMEQSTNLLQDLGVSPTQAVVDLGFRGNEVDQANPDLEIIHRGRIKTMTRAQRRWLKRRQAVEPAIRHLNSDNPIKRCWLQGATGDALHALCCALLRFGLQPALFDAGGGASGPEGPFVGPVRAGVLGSICSQLAHSSCDSQWQSVRGNRPCLIGTWFQSLKVNFAGPTR